MEMRNLSGRVAMVTGASRGIGAATAEALAARELGPGLVGQAWFEASVSGVGAPRPRAVRPPAD